METYVTLGVEVDGPVLNLVLHRPERRNAINDAMVGELAAVFAAAAERPGVRVVVLSGAGPVFCAGADLESMRAAAASSHDDNVASALRLADTLAAVGGCPLPVVARVHGAAMGGGAGLVAAADIAVAADSTRFAFSEVRLGLIPAVISPFVLPRIGLAATTELFLTGETFGADRAQAVGLVAAVVPEAELDQAVAERVAALLEGAPGAQGAAKALIRRVLREPAGARSFTAEAIAHRRASAEGQEGMAAFFDRRPPFWRPPRQDG
ncbi:MAG: enoyl-CoA hydratase-related protein [Anaerolineae bacterium]